jgi:hypothetical protein
MLGRDEYYRESAKRIMLPGSNRTRWWLVLAWTLVLQGSNDLRAQDTAVKTADFFLNYALNATPRVILQDFLDGLYSLKNFLPLEKNASLWQNLLTPTILASFTPNEVADACKIRYSVNDLPRQASEIWRVLQPLERPRTLSLGLLLKRDAVQRSDGPHQGYTGDSAQSPRVQTELKPLYNLPPTPLSTPLQIRSAPSPDVIPAPSPINQHLPSNRNHSNVQAQSLSLVMRSDSIMLLERYPG